MDVVAAILPADILILCLYSVSQFDRMSVILVYMHSFFRATSAD